MATAHDHRTDFTRGDTGPWLQDIAYPRIGKRVLLWSAGMFTGAALLGWGMLACAAVLGMGWGVVMLGVHHAARHDWQWCDACLQRMAAGAVVCPWCGRRE